MILYLAIGVVFFLLMYQDDGEPLSAGTQFILIVFGWPVFALIGLCVGCIWLIGKPITWLASR